MKRAIAALGMASLGCGLAQAQETRHTVDLGVAYNYLGDAVADGPTGNGVPANASMDVGNRTAVMLNYELLLTPNVGLQLATAIGGSVTVDGAGSIGSQGKLFKADPFSATAFVNYHFFDAGNALRPFLGVGVNYTAFSGIQSYTSQSVDIDNSWGLAAQGGVRYAIDSNWSVVATLGLAWVKSDVSFSDGGGTQRASIDFRPVVAGLGIGYSF
jgi:outer membrane protein